MELLIGLIVLVVAGLVIAGWAGLAIVTHGAATKGGAGKTGKADVLAKLDTNADTVVVTWPTSWYEPTVAEVVEHAASRGYRLDSQAGDSASHALTFTRP